MRKCPDNRRLNRRDYTKTLVEYLTDDYADWERKFLAEVKIRLDGIPAQKPAPAPVG